MKALTIETKRPAWNKGKLISQKRPLKEVWAIRVRLELSNNARDLALLNLAIDSKSRGCDLVKLKIGDIRQGNNIQSRASKRKGVRAI